MSDNRYGNKNMFFKLAVNRFSKLLIVFFTSTALLACNGESSSNITQEDIEIDNGVVETDADGTDVRCTENSVVIINNANVCPEE